MDGGNRGKRCGGRNGREERGSKDVRDGFLIVNSDSGIGCQLLCPCDRGLTVFRTTNKHLHVGKVYPWLMCRISRKQWLEQ